MRPIPRKILPNMVEYHKFINNSSIDPEFEDPVLIEKVAFQNDEKRANEYGHYVLISKGILFVDKVNSIYDGGIVPDDFIEENSKIVFNGKEYFVEEFQRLDYEQNRGIHHWEVLLK